MGNSEVGHLNLGSGRIVYQDLTRITKDVESGEFYNRPVMKELYKVAKEAKLTSYRPSFRWQCALLLRSY